MSKANAALCRIDDIPEDGCLSLDDTDNALFAVKSDGQIYIYRNRCPHLGVELNWVENEFLDSDGAFIICSTHGALFMRDTGECIAGPCQGEHLEALAWREEGGSLYLSEAS